MTSHKPDSRTGGYGKERGQELLGPNSEIGRKLKQLYDGVASEAVPDRFSDLLARLEDSEQGEPAKGEE